MGNVKSINSLAEQINFVEQTLAVIEIQDHQAVMNAEQRDLFRDILANLKMVQCWVMLPDYHQAALEVLNASHNLDAELRVSNTEVQDTFDVLVRVLANLRHINAIMPEADMKARLSWVASMALLGTAKFIIPTKPKEVRDEKR